MKLCLAAALCRNGFDGGVGGGSAIVHYGIWKIVRPSEKILATPLLTPDRVDRIKSVHLSQQ